MGRVVGGGSSSRFLVCSDGAQRHTDQQQAGYCYRDDEGRKHALILD